MRTFLLVTILLVLSITSTSAYQQITKPFGLARGNVRKNVLSLTPEEWNEFASAVLKLKYEAVNSSTVWSTYDHYVDIHNSNGQSAHMGPAFFPWHRMYLYLFEAELQRVSGNPKLTIPYWNWADETNRMKLFNEKLVGGNGTDPHLYVEDGPFAKWPHIVVNGTIIPQPITRGFNTTLPPMPSMPDMNSTSPELPTFKDLVDTLSISLYDSWPYNITSHHPPSFRNAFEGWEIKQCTMHNAVHVWTGGVMRTVPVAPNDPLFFLHHSYVDKMYTIWQQFYHSNSTSAGFQPMQGARIGHNYGDEMAPFAVLVADGVLPYNFDYSYEMETFDAELIAELSKRQQNKEIQKPVIDTEIDVPTHHLPMHH